MMTDSPLSLPLDPHRQQIPALANKAYFNYGGQGPMPKPAIAAVNLAQEYVQRIGPFSGQANSWITQESAQVRAAIAAELGTTSETIALTEDVSVGCNIALWGIDWREGDHLLLTDCEHPGIIAAAEEIRQRFGVKITTCPLMKTLNEGDPVEVITQNLLPTTRLVVLSHILWNTGQVLPLADIVAACRRYPSQYAPVRILVDAAQSVGVLPLSLDELGADFYAFTGHKWWCGAAGVGGLYIHPNAIASLRPTFIGWRSITTDATGQPTGLQPDSRRYEVATSNYALYSGLREAIAFHQRWGTAEQRYQRICTLSQRLWEQLQTIPNVVCLKTTPPDAGLVSFRLQNSREVHKTLVDKLEKQGFLLRTILYPNCVRACIHYFTSEEEIDRLVIAIQQLTANSGIL